jgi:sugar phosphate permease
MKSRSGLIFALWFLALVNYLERVTMSFAGPSIMHSMALSPAQFGIVLSSFGVGYTLAQFPGGLIADRVGARTLLILGPILWAFFTGMTGLATALAGFVVIRICFGLSEGLSNSSIYKTIGDNFDSQYRARVLAICSSAIPIAPAISGVIVGGLIAAHGWQAMFFIMVIPALLAAMFCYIFIPRHSAAAAPVKNSVRSKAAVRELVRMPSLWLMSIGCFSWNIPYWGFLGWMPSYLSLEHHIDLKGLGAVAGLPYVFAFIGLLLAGWLGSGKLDRYCAHIAAGCFVGAGISLYLAYQAPSLLLALAGLSGAAFFLFGSSAPIGKLVLDLAPEEHRAAYVGFYNSFGQIGGALAPAAIGILVSMTGTFAGGFALMVVSLAVGAVCLITVSRIPAKVRSGAAAVAPGSSVIAEISG